MLLSPAPFLSDHVPFVQSAAYATTLRALGRTCWTLEEPGLGRTLMIERDFRLTQLAATMRGPLWETHEADAQVAFLRATGVHLVNAENTTKPQVLRQAGFFRVMTPAHMAVMDLLADLPGAMATKWRNAWRQGQRAGLRIKAAPFDAGRDNWILALDAAHQIAGRFQGYPVAFTQALAHLNPREVWTYTAHKGKDPVAAMIFVSHAPTATYHIGWTSPEGRSTNAHHVLLIQAAQDFAKLGILNMDLGQIDTRRAPGLARFKWGSGARVIATGGTWLRLGWG